MAVAALVMAVAALVTAVAALVTAVAALVTAVARAIGERRGTFSTFPSSLFWRTRAR